jgi:cyclopropane fatty-acyl-phospholipid synthase-like methyltransferase
VADPFRTVQSGYDHLGAKYRDWSRDTSVRLTWLRKLSGRVDAGSVIVDLGCGPGEPVTRLLAHDHRVIAVDGSRTQLRLAQVVAPTALLIEADMMRCWFRPSSVDAVASFYALGHVPSDRHAPLFAAIAEWLRPGGVLLTSAPLGIGDGQDPDWLGVPMFFGGIGETATREAIGQAGLDIEEWEIVSEDEGDGRHVEFLWLIARKPTIG